MLKTTFLLCTVLFVTVKASPLNSTDFDNVDVNNSEVPSINVNSTDVKGIDVASILVNSVDGNNTDVIGIDVIGIDIKNTDVTKSTDVNNISVIGVDVNNSNVTNVTVSNANVDNTDATNVTVSKADVNSTDANHSDFNSTNAYILRKHLKDDVAEYRRIQRKMFREIKPVALKEDEYVFDVARNYTRTLDRDLDSVSDSMAKAFEEPKVDKCRHHSHNLLIAYEERKTEILDCAESHIEKADATLLSILASADDTKSQMKRHISNVRYCRNSKCEKAFPGYIEFSKSALEKFKMDIDAYYAILKNAGPVIDCIERPLENKFFSDNKKKYLGQFDKCMGLITNKVF